jgi:hypothetical protein
MFHVNDVKVGEYECGVIPSDFVQFICARQIILRTPLLDEPHRNNIFRFITGTGKALEKVHINSFGTNQGEFCELLVNASFYYF